MCLLPKPSPFTPSAYSDLLSVGCSIQDMERTEADGYGAFEGGRIRSIRCELPERVIDVIVHDDNTRFKYHDVYPGSDDRTIHNPERNFCLPSVRQANLTN